MKRILIASLVLPAMLFGLTACEKQTAEPASTAATATTTTQTMTAAADPDPGVEPNGYVVRVDFDNAISHIFTKDIKRAVLISEPNHTSKLTIMYSTEDDLELIETAFGKGTVKCSKKQPCQVLLPDGLTLGLIDEKGGTMRPTPVERTNDFYLIVPHLKTVANIKDEALGTNPNKDFKVFFDFNGGKLWARPCGTMLKLKYKDLLPIDVDQHAADLVTLSGTTEKPPVLAINRAGTVSKLLLSKLHYFHQSKLVWLIVDNEPPKDNHSVDHFSLHQKVGKGPQPDFPVVGNPEQHCFEGLLCYADRGVTVACGNTQWP